MENNKQTDKNNKKTLNYSWRNVQKFGFIYGLNARFREEWRTRVRTAYTTLLCSRTELLAYTINTPIRIISIWFYFPFFKRYMTSVDNDITYLEIIVIDRYVCCYLSIMTIISVFSGKGNSHNSNLNIQKTYTEWQTEWNQSNEIGCFTWSKYRQSSIQNKIFSICVEEFFF